MKKDVGVKNPKQLQGKKKMWLPRASVRRIRAALGPDPAQLSSTQLSLAKMETPLEKQIKKRQNTAQH